MFDFVLYHKGCFDGMAAAWTYSKTVTGTPPKYVGIGHARPFIPKDIEGKKVLMLDFCYPSALLKELIDKVDLLTIIDHHIGNVEILQAYQGHPKLRVIMNTNFSGAELTHAEFHQKNFHPLINYIGDRDTWKFNLPSSKEINAYIYSRECSFESLDKLHLNWNFDYYKSMGKLILEIYDVQHKNIMDSFYPATLITPSGKKYQVMIGDCNFQFRSDVGNKVVEANKDTIDFVVLYTYYSNTRLFSLSLRGCGKHNLSEVAKEFGGKGHFDAAGFHSPHLDFIHHEPVAKSPQQ